jgi:hypothetical protein
MSAHTAATDQPMPPSKSENVCCRSATKAMPVASAAMYTTTTAALRPLPGNCPFGNDRRRWNDTAVTKSAAIVATDRTAP